MANRKESAARKAMRDMIPQRQKAPTTEAVLDRRGVRLLPVPKQTGKPRRRTVVVSDVHFPKQDPAAWDIALQAITDLKPDSLWILGDFLDLASVSGHGTNPGEEALTLRTELAAGNVGLDDLDRVAGSACERLFFDGNHEYRLERYMASGRCPRELRDGVPSVREALFLRERGYRYIAREEQPFLVGDLNVLHGQWYNRHHAAKHLDALGVNLLYGHVHTPQVFTHRNVTGSLTATCVPCLRTLDREWCHLPKVNSWLHGFNVIEWSGAGASAHASPYNVYIHKKTASYGGFTWAA